jgi:hypothetical protein
MVAGGRWAIKMSGLRALWDGLGPRAVGVIVFVFLLPIYALFAHFGQEGRGLVVVDISAVFIFTVYVNAENIGSFLFASVLALLFAVQVTGAFFLTLPERFPGSIMLPIAFVDLLLVLGIMNLVAKWERSRSGSTD